MALYVRRRLTSLVLVWVVLSFATFGLEHTARGDPAELALQHELVRPATVAEIHAERHRLELDRPLAIQYASWAWKALRGDFGNSWEERRPVRTLFVERLPRTALLAGLALLVGLVIAVPLGVVSAQFRGTWVDQAVRVGTVGLASFPGFVLAYLLIYVFGVRLHVLPVFGFGHARSFVLPVLTLSVGSAAATTRLARSGMLDTLDQDFIRTATAKGASRRRVVWRHALRNALNPIVSLTGLRLGYLLSGTVIVESIFAWPGLGKLVLDAIYARDYPVLQGFILLSATTFVLVNLLVDIAYVWVDPRVRLGAAVS